jgi:hypothetical protein
MPKKLLRINQPKQLDVEKYLNKDLDLVMETGAVYFGQINKIAGNQIHFSDKIRNKHVFELSEIQELIIAEIHQF